MSSGPVNAYAMGRLLAALERDGWLDGTVVDFGNSDMPSVLQQGLSRIGPSGGAVISGIISRIGDMPSVLSGEQMADFWLGYWHFRAGKDREAVDSDPKTERYELRLTRRQKEWIIANGGSGRIAQMIDEIMGPLDSEP